MGDLTDLAYWVGYYERQADIAERAAEGARENLAAARSRLIEASQGARSVRKTTGGHTSSGRPVSDLAPPPRGPGAGARSPESPGVEGE